MVQDFTYIISFSSLAKISILEMKKLRVKGGKVLVQFARVAVSKLDRNWGWPTPPPGPPLPLAVLQFKAFGKC